MIDSYGAHSDKHAWLGIDPGVTTGWALMTDNGKVVGCGNLVEHDLRATLDTLIRASHGEGYRLTAVVERMPRSGIGRLTQRLDFVNSTIRELVDEVYELPKIEVTPGVWKQSRVAKTQKRPRGKLTQHQWDAIRMTLYVIDREARRASK